jgi:hypothetical protein
LLSKEDIVFFTRALSREPHLAYSTFINMISPSEENSPPPLLLTAVADGASTSTDADEPFQPRGGDSLLALHRRLASEDRAREAALEKEYGVKIDAAQRLVARRMNSADFSWLRTSRSEVANPVVTLSSIHYDFSRGEPGIVHGTPAGVEACGKWQCVNTGKAQVPCVKMFGGMLGVDCDDEYVVDSVCVARDLPPKPHSSLCSLARPSVLGCAWQYFKLRVPFRAPGADSALTSYTVTIVTKMPYALNRFLLSTTSFTEFGHQNVPFPLVYKHGNGFGSCGYGGRQNSVHVNTWHVLTWVVDAAAGTLTSYIDGERSTRMRNMSAMCAGASAHALHGEIAVFGHDNNTTYNGEPCNGDYYLRSVTIHARVLSKAHVKKEVGVLRAMLIEDAIAQLPTLLQPLLAQQHVTAPFESTSAVLAKVAQIKRAAMSRVKVMWGALLRSRPPMRAPPANNAELDAIMGTFEDYDLSLCHSWRPPFDEEGDVSSCAASETEHAGSLLCLAAYAGAVSLVEKLLSAGAPVSHVR